MKKLMIFAILAILCSCAGTGSSKETDLDGAIEQACREINDALPSGTKVALLNFSSASNRFSDYVLEEMSISLVKAKKLVVVDRKETNLIRNEMNFQMSGDVSDESAQQIGKMLGAQSIVSGSLVIMEDGYRFRIKVIDVTTAALQTASSISIWDDSEVEHLLR